MKDQIEQLVSSAIKELYGIEERVKLTIPPQKSMGDYTTNRAFALAKMVKEAPVAIAEAIKSKLISQPVIKKVDIAAPGFINIFVDETVYFSRLVTEMQDGSFLSAAAIYAGKEASVEHTAANPNKNLHVGHLRNFSIGDTIVRVFKAVGYKTSIQYFLNDQGLQIAKVVWGLKHLDLIKEESPDSENEGNLTGSSRNSTSLKYDTAIAKIYVATELYLKEHPEHETEVRSIIQEMEAGNNDVAAFAEQVTRNVLRGHIATVEKFGVSYDFLLTETVMTQSKEVERIMGELLKTGKVRKETEGENAGCVVIENLTDEKGKPMDTKVLLRKDGTAVYTAKDIVLHLWKFGKYDIHFSVEPLLESNGHTTYITTLKENAKQAPTQNISVHVNVVDQRQSYPLEVVKQSLKLLGYPEAAKNFHHLAYETVVLSREAAQKIGETKHISVDLGEGKTVAMSDRKGIEVSIDDILAILTDQVYTQSKKKNEGLTKEESEKIAASALRYLMIRPNYKTIIVFDFQEALRTDGDTGIYLMYAFVRALNILKKAGIPEQQDGTVNEQTPKALIDLLRKLSLTTDVITSVAESLEVSHLAEHTFDIAREFMKFYQEVPILQEKDARKKALALATVQAFVTVYGRLLDILGIHKPERM